MSAHLPNMSSPRNLSDASGGGFEGGSGYKLLSVRFIFAAIFSVSIVMAVTFTSLLMISTYSEAVDDTKRNGEVATTQCFQQAERSLDTVASDLLTYSTEAVAGQIQNSFDLGWKHLQALEGIIATYPIPSVNSTSWYDNIHVKKALWHQLEFFRWPEDELPFITAVGIYIGDSFLSDMIHGGLQMGLHVNGLETRLYPLLPAGAYPPVGYPLNFINNDSAALVAARIDNVWPKGAYRWASLEKVNSFVGYTMVGQGSVHGLDLNVMCSMTLQSLSSFMENLVKTSRKLSGSETRMYTVVAKSWIKERKKEIWDNYTMSSSYPLPAAQHAAMERDYSDWWKFDQEHLLTSVSDGKVIRDTETMNPYLLDVEATDDVIHAVAVGVQAFPNKYQGINEHGATKVSIVRLNETDNSTYSERFFVQVTPVKNRYGIDWWLTTAIDEKYVYGEVTSKQIELQMEIASKTADVEDTITEKRTMTLVIVVFIGLFLTLVSLACAHITMIPLKTLSVDMNDVAVMKLDRISTFTHLSSLREIRLMQQHFHKMVQNLMEYRAYVPNAVMRQEVLVEPPATSSVAIVFTDIEGSTALWNFNPSSMNAALEIHNNVMRQAAIRHLGYEVKTIGDCFMMAFERPLNAIEFGLTVQQNLRSAEWPADLCFDQDGLRVRIGCHFGEVVHEENPMTGRTDYRGTTVNTASRLEAKAKSCTVCVTSELRDTLTQDIDHMSSIKTIPFGAHELKGLGQGHDLVLLVHKDVTLTDRSKSRDNPPDNVKDKWEESSQGGSTGSGGRNSFLGAPNYGKRHSRKPTGLSLVSGVATVAICVLKSNHRNNLFDDFNLMVRFVSEASNTCDGVVGAVTGTSILISWNTSKAAKRHHFNAMNFAADLERRASRIMTVGIATGVVLHGNIGTQKQRFHTVCGDPMDCSRALADHANAIGAFCLVGDCTHDKILSNDKSFIRTIDAWLLRDKVEEAIITVYELLSQKMVRKLEAQWNDDNMEDITSVDMSIVDHENSMAKLLSGDEIALDDLKRNHALNPGDCVLQNVIHMFETPIQADGARCEVEFNNIPHAANNWHCVSSGEPLIVTSL